MNVESNEFRIVYFASFVVTIFLNDFLIVPLLKELNIDGIPAGFLVTAIQQVVAFLVFLV